MPANSKQYVLGLQVEICAKSSDISLLCSCLAAFNVWNRKYQCFRFQTTSHCYTQRRTFFKGKRHVICAVSAFTR